MYTHPWKLTWHMENLPLFNRKYIHLQMVFRWHVSFGGGKNLYFTGDWNPGKASQEIWMDNLFPAKNAQKRFFIPSLWKSQSWLFGEGTSGYQWLISQLWSTIDRKGIGRIFIATLHPKNKRQALFPKKIKKACFPSPEVPKTPHHVQCS